MEIVKLMAVGAILFVSCSSDELSDAYGQFEVDEVLISAETTGKLLSFDVKEGELINENIPVAVIDTSTLALKKRKLKQE